MQANTTYAASTSPEQAEKCGTIATSLVCPLENPPQAEMHNGNPEKRRSESSGSCPQMGAGLFENVQEGSRKELLALNKIVAAAGF